MALTTLANAKEHLGIPNGNTDFDNLINRLIGEATRRIETYCDRFLEQRLAVEEFQDGFAQNRILLNQWPAVKPSELWIDGSGEFTDTDKKLDPSEYDLDLSAKGEGIGVVLKGGCYFPNGIKNIKVVYDCGYATIPEDLEGACLWTVQFLYETRTNLSVSVETKGKNQENITYRGDLPAFVKETLNIYKRFEWPTGDRQLSTR